MVSAHLGRKWQASQLTGLDDLASHPAGILSDGEYAVFVKLSRAAHGLDQFEVELAGLRTLAERTGVLTPIPLGNLGVEGGVLMVMEAAQAVERGALQWRQIGQSLARIHRIK